MAQVGDHRHTLDPGLVAAQREIRSQVEIERQGRAVATCGQREAFDHVVGQHGDLSARHINRRQPAPCNCRQGVSGADRQPGCGNVDADAPAPGTFRHREGIVDLGGMGVVDAEGGDLRQRQSGRLGGRKVSGETGTGREVLEQKAAQLVIMAIGECAALGHQARHRQPRLSAGRLQSLGFEPVAVGLVKQLSEQVAEFRRQSPQLQFFGHALDSQGLLPLLLQSGQGRLEDLRRRLAEAPAALAVEVDRCRMQAQQGGCGLDRTRVAAEIVAGEVGEGEFGVAAGFPEKVGVHAFGLGLGTRYQVGAGRLGEAQQHVRGLDLGALARCEFDLQRGVVVGEYRACPEGAVLFKKDIHGGRICQGGGLYRSKSGELEDLIEVVGPAAKAVVAAREHGLPGSGIFLHRQPVVEHFVAFFHHQPVAPGLGQMRNFQRFEFGDVRTGEFEALAGIEIGLWAEVFGQGDMGDDGGVDQQRLQPVLFTEIGRVIAAQRTADQGDLGRGSRDDVFGKRNRCLRRDRQLRTVKRVGHSSCRALGTKLLRLMRGGRRAETVQVKNQGLDQSTSPNFQVMITMAPKAMRYQAKELKSWLPL